MTGSYKIDSLSNLKHELCLFFTSKQGRFFTTAHGIRLRGPRYICALDPNLSVPQKLDIFKEDLCDSVDVLMRMGFQQERQHRELAPPIDYYKNIAVTLFNAYVQREKIGEYQLDNVAYQQTRTQLQQCMENIVNAYYASLTNTLTIEEWDKLLSQDNIHLLKKILCDMLEYYKSYILSSRYLVRAEASHPLVNLAFAYIVSTNNPEVDTLVGFPAGSTELTCLLQATYYKLYGGKPNVLFIPFSLHSIKQQFGEDYKNPPITQLIAHNRDVLEHKHVLLIDDNSSTGQTITSVRDAIVNNTHPQSVASAVAEADIVRSSLDKDSERRPYIAHPDLFLSSVGILPVSRRVRPKRDLREISERQRLANYYMEQAHQAGTVEERIKYRAFADGLVRTNSYIEKLPQEQVANDFHAPGYEFLSNFHPCRVVYNGKVYPSVEHGYQRAKFGEDVFALLGEEQVHEIQQLVSRRDNVSLSRENLIDLFTDERIRPGTTKIIAEQLKQYGIPLDHWDDERVDCMVTLLWQKFSLNPECATLLKQTNDMVLVEGNTWGDTFWGICNGMGRNMLGRLLMAVRDELQNENDE